MKLKLPHYRQKSDFDCGPATWKMVLGFFGFRVSIAKLIREMRTTKATGTTHRQMVRLGRRYGLRVQPKSGASVTDLRRSLAEGYPVIVNYILPEWEVSHYAVVSGMTEDSVMLHDPSEGAYYRLKLAEFKKRWRGWHRTVNHHWLLKISPKSAAAF